MQTFLLGDDVTMVENAPKRTPGLGGEITLRAEHLDSYTTRSKAYRYASNDCFRRGSPLAAGCKASSTCAAQLQGQLEALSGAPQSDYTANQPPSSGNSMKTVSLDDHDSGVLPDKPRCASTV